MKITLQDSIPEAQRPEVEALVKSRFRNCTIDWMPSRFPRFVILVEPDAGEEPRPEKGSFFESPRSGETSTAAITEDLENRIKACLASRSSA